MKIADFKSQDEMQKMTIPQIKAHVREYNDHYAIRGYSKLNKSQLISEVLTAQQRIRNAGKPTPKVADPAPKKKVADPRKRAMRQKELAAMKKPQLVEMVLPSDKKKTKQEIINLILKEENL
ncbi:MAG: hypothetical protein ACR2M9_01690 [Cyanophyceae cyanobacterium]